MEFLNAQDSTSPGQRFTRRMVLAILMALFSALAWGFRGNAQTASTKEYQVKAVFLFNFAKFIQWPSTAFASKEAPIIIGLVGEDPFGPVLDKVVAGETVKSRAFVIKRMAVGEEISGCHILFVSRSEKGRLGPLLEGVRKRPVLTVSEMERFGQQGGMINFVTLDNTVRFEINPGAATDAGLRVNAELLGLPKVRIVQTER